MEGKLSRRQFFVGIGALTVSAILASAGKEPVGATPASEAVNHAALGSVLPSASTVADAAAEDLQNATSTSTWKNFSKRCVVNFYDNGVYQGAVTKGPYGSKSVGRNSPCNSSDFRAELDRRGNVYISRGEITYQGRKTWLGLGKTCEPVNCAVSYTE
jgi:hypothetical protein